MNLVLDTSAYSAFITGRPDVVTRVRRAESIFIPAVVYGELAYGYRKGSRTVENMTLLQQFLAKERVQFVPVDAKIAEQYGSLRVLQEATGRIVAPNDLWIAATCLQLRLPLLTTDRDFSRIKGLDLVL